MVVLIEVKTVDCLAKAVNLAFVRAAALRRTDTCYELWLEGPDGRMFLVGRAADEDAGFELWWRLIEAVRRAGGTWVHDLSD